MIDEKYIERISIDKDILGILRGEMRERKITIKRLSEMDENLDYGYLRQVFQGNHPIVSYKFVKRICNCLDLDVAMVYSSPTKYPQKTP